MADERLKLLEDVPGWQANAEGKWHRSYRELQRWIDDNGRFPSRTAHDPDELRLGRWVDTQRRVRRKGDGDGTGVDAMQPERARRLEAITGWRWAPRDQTWRQSYDELACWAGTNRRLPSATADDQVERHLAHWVSFQRELHRRHVEDGVDEIGPEIGPDRQALLEAIVGWRWLRPRRRQDESWTVTRDELADWVAAHSRFPATSSPDLAERRLARWAVHQRAAKRRADHDGTGPMTSGRAALLGAIPGWEWSPRVGRRRT